MDRRQFLRIAGLGALSLSDLSLLQLGATWASPPAEGREFYIIGKGSTFDPPNLGRAQLLPDYPSEIRIWWPSSSSLSSIPIDHRPHGFAQNPVKRAQILAIHKWGRNITLVDVLESRVLRKFRFEEGFRFFGHGEYHPDGKSFFVSAMEDGKTKGFLSIRDAVTLQELGRISTFGPYPHECHWAEPGKILVVATSGLPKRAKQLAPGSSVDTGTQSGLTWIDIRSGKKVHQIAMPDPNHHISHFRTAPHGEIIAVGTTIIPQEPLMGCVNLIRSGGSVQSLSPPQELRPAVFRGESLSLAIAAKKSLVATTNPASRSVCFWSLEQGRYLGSSTMSSEVRGIVATADQENLVFNEDSGILSQIRLNDLKQERQALWPQQPVGGDGSHLYRFVV